MSLFLDPLFNAAASSHFIIDLINAQRSILFTFWSVELNWSETQLALVSTIYIVAASISQPVFGWLSDKFGKTRLIGAGGLIWISILFSLALFLPTKLAIACMILASFGSAAFHPVAAMQAMLRGRHHLDNRETTATSWFFVFGQFGLMVGPIIGGFLLAWKGQVSLSILGLIALPIGINLAWQLGKVDHQPRTTVKNDLTPNKVAEFSRGGFIVLAFIATFQAWTQQNMITFIPKYLSDLGQSSAVYGTIIGLFMGGSAIGNVVGGTLADRLGKQKVITIMLALASIPIYIISRGGWSIWLYLLVPLAGFFSGSVHSIIVVLAQHMIHSGMAMATGLTLGFMFSAGALGTLVSGVIADYHGFPLMFQFTVGLVLASAILPIFIRNKQIS